MSVWLTWDYWVNSALGAVHFGPAVAMLLLVPLILVQKKGTKFHRIAGTVYVVSMLAVNISALSMFDISGQMTLFHWFAILSLLTLLPGYASIWTYKVRRHSFWLEQHRQLMIWSYFGLCAAGAWQIIYRLAYDAWGPNIFKTLPLVLGPLTFLASFGVGYLLNRKKGAVTAP